MVFYINTMNLRFKKYFHRGLGEEWIGNFGLADANSYKEKG